MSTSKTTNLGLHAWERTDAFRMEEFNENFDKIDQAIGENKAALAGKADQTALDAVSETANAAARIYIGSYKGTGKSGQGNPTKITLPIIPKVLFIIDGYSSQFHSDASRVAVLVWGSTTQIRYGPSNALKYNAVSYSGNTVSWYTYDPNSSTAPTSQLNENNASYMYIAIA